MDMFNVNEPSGAVGFDSQWKVKKVTVQGASQTSPVTTEHASNSTNSTTNSEIQTDAIPMKTPEYDEQRLADFLKRLYPKVSKELNEAASSQVFKNHRADGASNRVQPKLLTAFKLTLESGDFTKSVSSLSWNATGKKLAVSVVQQHESWCHHTGMIFIHTFSGSQENEDKMLRIKTPSCITAISYHPTMPPILAVGTYTGEILLINTQNEENDQLLAKSTGHEAVITQVAWVEDLEMEKNHLLATGSLDGSLNMWSFNMGNNELKLKEKYKIKTPLFGKLQRKGETPAAIGKKVDRGIVSFDFSRHNPEKFIVAAEGGLIAQCSRFGTKELPGTTGDVRVSDPVFKYYRAHEGEITSIRLSPDRPELFASNGSDGEIRVYDMGEEEPGNVIATKDDTLVASWVPYSQNLIAAAGASGRVDFYDARNGRLMNSRGEKEEEAGDDACLTCMAFHSGRISVVAVGTKEGGVQIWDIPWNNY